MADFEPTRGIRPLVELNTLRPSASDDRTGREGLADQPGRRKKRRDDGERRGSAEGSAESDDDRRRGRFLDVRI